MTQPGSVSRTGLLEPQPGPHGCSARGHTLSHSRAMLRASAIRVSPSSLVPCLSSRQRTTRAAREPAGEASSFPTRPLQVFTFPLSFTSDLAGVLGSPVKAGPLFVLLILSCPASPLALSASPPVSSVFPVSHLPACRKTKSPPPQKRSPLPPNTKQSAASLYRSPSVVRNHIRPPGVSEAEFHRNS